jgi:hypothetical protein
MVVYMGVSVIVTTGDANLRVGDLNIASAMNRSYPCKGYQRYTHGNPTSRMYLEEQVP